MKLPQSRLGWEGRVQPGGKKAKGGQALRWEQWWESLQGRRQDTYLDQEEVRNCSRGRRQRQMALYPNKSMNTGGEAEYCLYAEQKRKSQLRGLDPGVISSASELLGHSQPPPWAAGGQRAIPSSQSFQMPLPCWTHPSPSF